MRVNVMQAATQLMTFQTFLRETLYIVLDAADWNTETQRFDSKCGGQTCAGNIGGREAGTVTTSIVAGNGAADPVAFVGGGQDTLMQWDAGSIPASFTNCSVTRYSGTNRMRILNARGNPSGALDWVHGQWNAKAGLTYYDTTNSFADYTIAINTDWVVTCGTNVIRQNSKGNIVNGITTRLATGGNGNGALGINHWSSEKSDWHLS